MPNKNSSGDFGENIAAAHLEQHGFQIVARNFRTRFGEIDLIAQNERYLLFVEVKTRKTGAFTSGEEAVDYHKQRKLRACAEEYLLRTLKEHSEAPGPHRRWQPRFDVVCVDTAKNGQVVSIRWHENAF